MTSYTPPTYPCASPCLTCSELVAHGAGPAAAGEDDEVTAGVLPLLEEVPAAGAVELAAVEPDVAGWLLEDEDEQPATIARPAKAAVARASRPGPGWPAPKAAGRGNTARGDTACPSDGGAWCAVRADRKSV